MLVTLTGALLITGGSNTDSTRSNRITLGPWQQESNLFTIYFASDSALFPPPEPLHADVHSVGDSLFFGTLLWNSRGDSLEDAQIDLVLEFRPDSTQWLYADLNNNEDMTDDGPPFTWKTDSLSEDYPFIELQSDLPSEHPVHARILFDENPVNSSLSEEAGRTVLTYALVAYSARRGNWSLDSINYPVELFTMHNSGRILGIPGEWFIIDIDRNGEFEFIPPDVRVLLTEPTFVYAGRKWMATVDTLGDRIILNVVDTLEKAATHEVANETSIDTGRYAGKHVHVAAKPFQLTTVSGDAVSLQTLRGKIIALNFWHTGCIPCRAEIPVLNGLVEDYRNRPVYFAAPTFNPPDLVAKFTRDMPFDYIILPDAEEMIADYGVSAYPVHMIIDEDGFIVFEKLGGSPDIDNVLRPVLDSLLALQGCQHPGGY